MTGKLPAPEVFGPQCVHVVALIERARRLTPGEVSALEDAWDPMLVAAWDAARDAAWVAARDAALDAALDAAEDAAWDAARDAAGVLVVRDLISTEVYDTLTRPWREAIGPIHPDDLDIQGVLT